MPDGLRIRLKTASADLTARGTVGGVEVKAASGDVTVADVDGDLRVDAASSDIRAASVTGDASVRSVSGDIELGRAFGPVNAQSVSGDVRLREAHGRTQVQTVSGDPKVDRLAAGSLSSTPSRGTSTWPSPPGAAVWLDLRSLSGDMSPTSPPATSPGGRGRHRDPRQDRERRRQSPPGGGVRTAHPDRRAARGRRGLEHGQHDRAHRDPVARARGDGQRGADGADGVLLVPPRRHLGLLRRRAGRPARVPADERGGRRRERARGRGHPAGRRRLGDRGLAGDRARVRRRAAGRAGVTAREALLPDVAELGDVRIERATGLHGAIARGSVLVGAPLGGVLVATLGSTTALWVDAVSFLVSAIVIRALVPALRPHGHDEESPARYLSQLAEGLRYVAGDRLLKAIVITVLITNCLDGRSRRSSSRCSRASRSAARRRSG